MFSTLPTAVTLAVGDTPTYTVGGGTTPYTASSSNLNVVTASVSGKTLTITGKASGSATITVYDATGKSLGTVATVGSPTSSVPLFVTAPESLVVPLNGTSPGYQISGGVGPYKASSSNATVAVASINGASLSITGAGTGVAQVSVFDSLGEKILLNVTVGSGNAATPLFVTVPSQVTIGVAEKPTYTIGGGTAPYFANSTNNGVAKVSVTGTTLNLEGVAGGTAQIQVVDSTGTSRSATVVVGSGNPAIALFMTAPNAVTVAPAATAPYTIGGGTGSYTASSSNLGTAAVSVVGSTLSITGVAAGTAQITVFDGAGASVSTVVTVSTGATIAPLYITAPVAVTLAPNGTESYFIGGGVGPYRVSSSNTSLVTASIPALPGNTLVVNGGSSTGNAQVTVFDSAGNSVSTTVTIGTSASTTTLFVTAPSAVTVTPPVLPATYSATYTIGGGKAPYYASSNNNGVATAEVVSSTTLAITGVVNGVAQINVLDSTGATARVTVNVGSGGTGLYMTAPSTFSIGTINPSNFAIGGGTAPYTVSVSNEAIATASVTGTALSIRGVAAGTVQVVVFDATGSSVSTSVTVGSSSTTDLYVTAPSGGVTMTVPTTETFTLGGGTAPYVPVSSNKGVALASLDVNNANAVKIFAVSAGTAQVVVFDASGKSITIGVTVVPPSAALFTTAPAAVTIGAGGAREYTVGGGSGVYNTPISSNQAVASASLVGSTLTVHGITAGSATITVRDSLNATALINVTVNTGVALFTSAPAAVTLAPGPGPSFTIGGGTPITGVGTLPYVTSSSNAGVVTSVVSMVGTTPTLTLTGVAAGSAVINVLDSTGALVAINVTVVSGAGGGAALFTTAPPSITIANGAPPVEYVVGGGTAPYTATSSNPAVVTTTPTGALVGGRLPINSVGPGTASVQITDAIGAVVSINVTVTPAATTPLMVTPSSVTANVGDVLSFSVSGGSPAYSIAVNIISVATASPIVVVDGRSTFTITLKNVGSTSVTITDSLGQTTTLTLTVNATATTLRLSPSAITVGEDFTGAVTLSIYGGTGPYSAFTDDLVLSSVSNVPIINNVFAVGLGSKGNRCIDSIDRTDPTAPVYVPYGTVPVTLTVVDSLGASATSVMTIRDNGVSPGGGC